MDESELKQRTKHFALRVIKLVDSLPKSTAGGVIGSQLIRCGTSVGANYRAACRARSKAEFIAKLGIVEEEADESGLMSKELVETLMQEADELTAIMVASRKSTSAPSTIKNQKSKI